MNDDLHPISNAIVTITALASGALALWMTVIAFTGGTMPIIGLETDGGVGFGLLWLMVVDPIVLTVCYWISMVISMPVVALVESIRK